MSSKPYRAKSLAGAQRRVRELTKVNERMSTLLDQYAGERLQLAKLASRTPLFYNPLHVMAVENIRDGILKAKGLI